MIIFENKIDTYNYETDELSKELKMVGKVVATPITAPLTALEKASSWALEKLAKWFPGVANMANDVCVIVNKEIEKDPLSQPDSILANAGKELGINILKSIVNKIRRNECVKAGEVKNAMEKLKTSKKINKNNL